MLESEGGQKTRAKRCKLPDWGDGELAGRFVRYRLWRLHSQLMREHGEQVGIRFLAHPPEATDEKASSWTSFAATPPMRTPPTARWSSSR